jgi:hypothetical protein
LCCAVVFGIKFQPEVGLSGPLSGAQRGTAAVSGSEWHCTSSINCLDTKTKTFPPRVLLGALGSGWQACAYTLAVKLLVYRALP